MGRRSNSSWQCNALIALVCPSVLVMLRTPDHNVGARTIFCQLALDQRGCVNASSLPAFSLFGQPYLFYFLRLIFLQLTIGDPSSQPVRNISFASSMALEGIAALSFAGNIIQFIDTGVRLFSKSRKLYKSHNGVLLESTELEIIATSIKELSEQLTTSPPSQHQRSLENSGLRLLAQSCNNVAEELLSALEKLKIRGSERRKWQSFRVALSAIWKSEDIEDMAKRLDLLSKQLTTEMICTLQ